MPYKNRALRPRPQVRRDSAKFLPIAVKVFARPACEGTKVNLAARPTRINGPKSVGLEKCRFVHGLTKLFETRRDNSVEDDNVACGRTISIALERLCNLAAANYTRWARCSGPDTHLQ